MHIEHLSFFYRAVTYVVLLCFCTTQVVRADEIIYFHNDAAGTPQVATDASGAVLWREHYRPYGSRLDFSAAASTNKVWFTGKPQDASTGLSYMGARYYDPTLGRFSSVDPAGYDEQDLYSLNQYAYANNNPYKFVDPDGRFPIVILIIFAISAMAASDAANAPDMISRDEPQGGAARFGTSALMPIGWGARIPQVAVRTETAVGQAAARETTEVAGQVAGQGFKSHSAMVRALGPAGPNKHWHHIVEQTDGNVARFGAETVHNTSNVIAIDAAVHARISAFYSRIVPGTNGLTVRKWLATQSFQVQKDFGRKVLRDFGILPP